MSGNKSRNKQVDRGLQQQMALTREAMALQQPYVDQGYQAANQLSAFSGMGSPEAQAAAADQFQNSMFNQIAMGDYERDRGRIANQLAAQGLAYSSAFLNADAEAYADRKMNAFANFLNNTTNLAGMGVSATGANTNLLQNQGNSAYSAGVQKAGMYRSPLDTIGQISQIGANVGRAMSGF